MNDYEKFVSQKLVTVPPTGLSRVPKLGAHLFPFQADVVKWALRRGRAAAFLDTGLGKTRISLTWAKHVAKHTGGNVLILAPLAVGPQTAAEGERIGIPVTICREAHDVRPGLNITNYDRLHKFDASQFAGVVLDESSCIKHHSSKTLSQLLEAFAATPFRLACTATPSPNDIAELGTHAEFLGICSRTEMLAEFFVHDGGDTGTWRLKGHARDLFWAWVSTWAAMVRKPSDLGYDDAGYDLPGLTLVPHVLPAAEEARTLSERRAAKKGTLSARVRACADLVNADDEPWVVWCDLNAEGDALTRAIRGAVQVAGSDTTEDKEARLERFSRGEHRVLVSKASICGWGLNWQHAARMAFVGVNDSFEGFYQAVRRCYQFGQKRPVEVHVFSSELEGAVTRNLERKQADATRMAEELSSATRDAMRMAVKGQVRTTNSYSSTTKMTIPDWMVAA